MVFGVLLGTVIEAIKEIPHAGWRAHGGPADLFTQ